MDAKNVPGRPFSFWALRYPGVVLLVLWVALSLWAAGPSSEEHYRAGTALLQQGRLVEASERLRLACEGDTRNAQYAKAYGVSLAMQKRYAEADAPFARACSLNPSLVDACYYYGRNLYALDRFDASLKVLEKALASDSRPWRIWLGMAQAQHGMGRPAEAYAGFRTAVRLYRGGAAPSDDPRVHFGSFLFRQGRLEDAEAVLKALCNERPDSGRGHLELGRVYLQASRLQEAEREFTRALELDGGEQAQMLLDRTRARQAH